MWTILHLGALAGLAAGASVVGSSGIAACSAQSVLDMCVATQSQMLAMCSYSDWACKCQAQRTIAGCFANCPDDGARAGHEGQVTVFCSAARSKQQEDEERAKSSASSSAAAAAPKRAETGRPAAPRPGAEPRAAGPRAAAPGPRPSARPGAGLGAGPVQPAGDAAAGAGRGAAALPAFALGLAAWMAV
ncbi:hypothetical protein H4R18_003386 [Coemansia javaensis]|uniref:Extracellular membrane protein CFEM domain-containing protein n=1 Tax=Coemansia javaensis TaxID=2761396 RepID=A0A9W8HEU3_9FUNG|nr:hypothetical protein H4R18_003386 [Coemansia javaensis]